jgi:RNA polymerase sigma-70 factor (ECF subfamily)
VGDEDLPLVQSLQAGNDSALDELMGRHQTALFGFIYRYVRNEADAAELTQETFVRAYFHIGSYRPKAKFVTWLYRIATNLCCDHVRSRHGREAGRTSSMVNEDGTSREFPSDTVAPDEAIVQAERGRQVEQAIDQLPHDLKTALILTALEGLSHIDAAQRLGITPKAVETRVHRARKRLGETMRADMIYE